MNVIEIQYPFLFFKRKAKGSMPNSWAELTESQFIAISRVLNGIEPDYRYLAILTGIKKRLLQKLSSYDIFKISNEIDFIGKADKWYDSFIIKDICRRVSNPNSGQFHSPMPKLEGFTFGQFIFCDAYYNDYVVTKNENALNHLIASLYLSKEEKFESKGNAYRSWKVNKVDLDIRQAIAFNWGLIIAWLGKAYPLIFREPVEDNEPQTGDKPTVAKQSPWIKVFESLVGDDLINRDKYAELQVHTVLKHLTKKYKENAKKKW
jgi:hypothetical protein